MERKKYIYDGTTFEEGELVLVNGKELMYCRFVDRWMGGDCMFVVYAPRYKTVHRYEPKGDNYLASPIIKCTAKGDKIEHVHNPEPYNKDLQPDEKESITNGYLVDGWIICIILMVVTLMFKPVGAWSLSVLGIWLMLQHEEIERIKSMKK